MPGLITAFPGVSLRQLSGILCFDCEAPVVIGFILGGTALRLAYETRGLLIGESAHSPLVEGIKGIAASFGYIEHVNEVLTLHMHPVVLADISLEFNGNAPVRDVENAVYSMDREIQNRYPQVNRVFIEAEERKARGNAGKIRR